MEKPESFCRKGAEAILNVQPNSSISIAYHPLFGPHDDLILLELDEKLLPDVIHHRVSIRGQLTEDAVLCTQSKTYAVKFVGTSNSVFLVPPSNQFVVNENPQDCNKKDVDKIPSVPILKVATGVMELVEVAPRLDKLKLILSENPYNFKEDYDMDELDSTTKGNTGLYRLDDLTERVQASDEELENGLKTLSAIEIDGYWRIVDEKYMDGLLKTLLHNSVLNGWSLNAFNEDEVLGVMEADGFPRKLARHCLQVYGNKISGTSVWELDMRRVCVHFARGMLMGGRMKVENFMQEWAKKVPEGMQVSFDMLEGEVLIDKLGFQKWVYAFSVSSLPFNPADRFSRLFQERPKWEWKDLQPYIRDLRVPGLTSEGLLLKYTRRTQPTLDAEPVFTAR